MINRNDVLKDLRNHIIEISDVNKNMRRCTLRMEMLPKSYEKEYEEEVKFHNENTDKIVAWDIRNHCWRLYDIKDITYLQIIDGE